MTKFGHASKRGPERCLIQNDLHFTSHFSVRSPMFPSVSGRPPASDAHARAAGIRITSQEELDQPSEHRSPLFSFARSPTRTDPDIGDPTVRVLNSFYQELIFLVGQLRVDFSPNPRTTPT